jgi:phosphoglycerate dehydrogenase-like enzyme
VEGDREGIGRDLGLSPLRILVSAACAKALAPAIAQACAGREHALVIADGAQGPLDAEIAFVSRDVTGRSTKHELEPATLRFHDTMRGASALRWVHTHSAGADRPIFQELAARGVRVTTSSGANAAVVAQTALAGLLALARRFPQLWAAQREGRWAPLHGQAMPRDLQGQHAVLVGWGPVAQALAALLQPLGLQLTVVRHSAAEAGAGLRTVGYDRLREVLPAADWLVLACPLTERTRGLVGAAELACLPPGAHLLNVARGEVVDEPALVEALLQGKLAGAFLDVFAHEPLPAPSPLWQMPNVIATPHCAGFSAGNEARVAQMFLDNLRRWCASPF